MPSHSEGLLRAGLLGLAVAGLVGCSPGPGAGCDGGLVADGGACAAPSPCGPAERRDLTTGACAKVGWTECPQGFELDDGGRFCRDVLPAGPCAGALRQRLGDRACQPVGDCAAAFPPPSATLFVDAALDGGAGPTRFRTLFEALAAAPAGAVIAVEAGRYVESFSPSKSVTLVGRCAEKVVLVPSTGGLAGLDVTGAIEVAVRGVTVSGFRYGAQVFEGAHLTLADAVLDGNEALGAFVADPGSRLALDRSVIRRTHLDGSDAVGWGLLAEGGAEVALAGAELSDNTDYGVMARQVGTRLTLRDSVIMGTKPSVMGAAGLIVHRGASATVERAAFVRNSELGIVAQEAGDGGTTASVSLDRVVVRDTEPTPFDRGAPGGNELHFGRGLGVQGGARLDAVDVTLTGNHEQAVTVGDPGSRAGLSRVSIVGTLPNANGILGRGVAVFGGGSASLEDALVADNREISLDVSDPGSRGSAARSVLARTLGRPAGDVTSVGVLSRATAWVRLEASVIDATVGVGVMASGGGVGLSACLVSGNQVALHAQAGSALREVDALSADGGTADLELTRDTLLLENQARVGLGTLPVPEVAKAP